MLPYFNVTTPPLIPELQRSILPGREGCWDTKKTLSSFRFDRMGRLVFGSVGALRGTGTRVQRARAKRSLQKIFPQSEMSNLKNEWYGKIGTAADSLPRFQRLGRSVVSLSG
jgi:glycine/D-amino acid oxidase-like deaminating enzyme